MPLKKLLVGLVFATLLAGCANNSEEDPGPQETFVVNDFTKFIDENPAEGSTIGNINASSTEGTLTFSLLSQNPIGAIEVGAATGAITVADETLFVFTQNPVITASVEVTDGIETKTSNVTINLNDPSGPSFNIWTGPKITFTKQDGANPTSASNQDRITDNVWITRGNNGGQIYNAKTESSADKNTSPADTEWARGTTADIESLTFAEFRSTISPKSVVGENLVLHLITDDVYIDVKFLSWSSSKRGGFSYERSTEN